MMNQIWEFEKKVRKIYGTIVFICMISSWPVKIAVGYVHDFRTAIDKKQEQVSADIVSLQGMTERLMIATEKLVESHVTLYALNMEGDLSDRIDRDADRLLDYREKYGQSLQRADIELKKIYEDIKRRLKKNQDKLDNIDTKAKEKENKLKKPLKQEE